MARQSPKVPPQDIEMEKALLGALMLSSNAMYEVADMIGIDSFYSGTHRTVSGFPGRERAVRSTL